MNSFAAPLETQGPLSQEMPPPPRTKSTIGEASTSARGGQTTLLSLAKSGQWGDAGGEGQRTGRGAARPGAMRQASIADMSGVVNWRRGEREPTLEGVPTTLYLGEADVLRIKERLSAATEGGDEGAILALLQRLAAMPCTRPLLERRCADTSAHLSTTTPRRRSDAVPRGCLSVQDIGVVVGKLRRHASAPVAQLAERLVKVWKGQLKEHRAQQSDSAARGRPKG